MPRRKINNGGRKVKINEAGTVDIVINKVQPAAYDRTIFDLVADGRYNAFANDPVTMDAEKKIYFFRSGGDHLNDGRIDAIDYNRISKIWSNRRTIYTPAAGCEQV